MNNRPVRPVRAAARAGGFTLVELLVTITIISILAAVALGALVSARQLARESRTKSLIAKLDQVIMRRYDSYRTRRVPIDTSGLEPLEAARVRLRALRELIRMEMPDRLSDVYLPGDVTIDPGSDPPYDPPNAADETFPVQINSSAGQKPLYRPALARMYFRRFIEQPPNDQYISAELLYMIVTMGHADDKERFSENEVGDADSDRLPEFQDGWGNPIKFLRWAPAFIASEIQPAFVPSDQDALLEDVKEEFLVPLANERHDPFDTRNCYPYAYRLIPLIYSAGADGIYDVNEEEGYVFAGDPFDSAGLFNNAGQPMDGDNTSVTEPGPANGSLDHLDNIHNHLIEQR